MKISRICLFLFFITSASGANPEIDFRQQFNIYPAKNLKYGKKASTLRWKMHAKTRRYRTYLQALWSQATEPNFAGHYFVPQGIGCGTGCAVIFIIEWETGEIFPSLRDSAFAVVPKSRLLILDPFPPGYLAPPEFYEFTDRKLRKVSVK